MQLFTSIRATAARFRVPEALMPLLSGWVVCPIASLAIHAAFGATGLVVAAIAVPLVAIVYFMPKLVAGLDPEDAHGKTLGRAGIESILDSALATRSVTGTSIACLVLQVDAFDSITTRIGHRGCDQMLDDLQERLAEKLRAGDAVGRLDGATFVIALSPASGLDLEAVLAITARLQETISQPVSVDATTLRVSASVGFCQAERVQSPTGATLIDAAEAALGDARSSGAGSIRAYSNELHKQRMVQHALAGEVAEALSSGDIRPWFQPQVSTDTGLVTGMEALARWIHPERGLIPPGEFLPAVEQAGLIDRLGQVMLYHSLTAIRSWDRLGLKVPSVGLNFSADELRDPSLLDRIRWDLDRFDLAPGRIAIEILETVIANSPDDIICRNIAGLSEFGCSIDLDDFGTGNSSITSVRRFAVNRLKIDRSFVSSVDQDPEQQRMVTAILTMADRLDLDTLAEGVETPGEHAILAQLGCRHVQGYGIARPMPFEDTPAWLQQHKAKLARTPTLRSGAS